MLILYHKKKNKSKEINIINNNLINKFMNDLKIYKMKMIQ